MRVYSVVSTRGVRVHFIVATSQITWRNDVRSRDRRGVKNARRTESFGKNHIALNSDSALQRKLRL